MRTNHTHLIAIVCLLSIACSIEAGEPVVVEPGWALTRLIDFPRPMTPRFHPIDGDIYAASSDGGTDGVYRIGRTGFSTLLASATDPAAVMIDPVDGDIFHSEHYSGQIFRTEFGSTGRELWVDGFHSGDDDPVGMAIAPLDYAGAVVAPGDAVVCDWGNSGADEVWAWSPATPEGETVVHADDGTLVQCMDAAISSTTVYVVDAVGVIYEVGVGGTLTEFVTSEPITGPMAIVIDPSSGDLLVLDSGESRIVRIDPDTGDVSDVLTGLVLDTSGLTRSWAALDVSSDGRRFVVCEFAENAIRVYSKCDDPANDCNGNGVDDLCDIAFGDAQDCNGNGVPDSCDILDGRSSDCDRNGIPDECPLCPNVEVVFIMDTSSSMNDEAAALCSTINAVVAELQSTGIDVTPTIWGVSNAPGGAYACLTDDVISVLGNVVPGDPPPGLELLGDCPGGSQVASEDWGLAVAVVAGDYPWSADALRVIIPLSDEGPWCGDPVSKEDEAVIDHAISVAVDNDVVVSPVTGSGAGGDVIALAQALANGTGGVQFESTEPAQDLAEGVLGIIVDACLTITDCNENGVPDECDIEEGTSLDMNRNGIPDECECLGDFNFDGAVDVADLLILLGLWGPCDAPCGPDTNNNGAVDANDLLAVLDAWGPCD